jgi:predicted Ser/Thr protein kinase
MDRDERDAFVRAACAGAPDLRRKLQRLLAAHERAGSFLELPLPEVLAHDLPRGSVARWRLLECVGEGGLGVVYRAECIEDGVRLEAAVKILRPGFDTGKFREKFVRERQILAGLDHPGIVKLLDCGADAAGRSFLVMEYVRGEPLNRYLERTDPAPSERLSLFQSVCESVGYLHSRLVVHGDLKPANVLVTPAGIPKLLDFGAAGLLAGAATRGELTRLILTPQYASPERKRGEGPSIAGDIYSLGRILEEISPETSRDSDLRYILSRAMAERPAERYLSVSDLLEDLRRMREGFPLRSRPATAAYVARRFLRRNWVVTSLAALLAVSLAGGWWRAERASRRAAENQARLQALVSDLLDDDDADPNILARQEAAAEKSLRRAAASLEALPGPPRWHELSVAWRRLAMILVHHGRFTAAEEPLEKARHAAGQWLRSQPSDASRRNALLTSLCRLRLARQRGAAESGYLLAHEALAEFRLLPAGMQAELNGTVWLENARLTAARESINQNRLDSVPALLMEVVRNTHARRLTQTRNLGVANLIWTYRRLNRLDQARRWCALAREWGVADPRIRPFCAEPLSAFGDRDALFPVIPGALSAEDLPAILSRINQLILDLHEDPRSFPLNISLGRAHARLAEHYLATGQTAMAHPAAREAASIRNALLAGDSASPVILNFTRRVDALQKTLGNAHSHEALAELKVAEGCEGKE